MHLGAAVPRLLAFGSSRFEARAAETAATSSIFSSTSGFQGTSFTWSAGGNAFCVNGYIPISASATNEKINYSVPDNYNVTGTIQKLLESNPTIYTEANGGTQQISGTWNIAARLCFPSDLTAALKVSTVQVLTHGATLDSTYFDFATGYSYIDAAAKAGYATFSYDRLGVGNSAHPDPIQVVQAPLELEILHQIITKIRAGVCGKSFKNVVGIGHSAGATFTQAVTAKYPNDFDAVVITGTSTSTATVGTAEAAFVLQNANTQSRFYGIANGYFTFSSGVPGVQFAYFRYPYFETSSKLFLSTILVGHALTVYSRPETSCNNPNQHTRRTHDLRQHRLPLNILHEPSIRLQRCK